MKSNLPDDSNTTEDDAPVKVSYHAAPGSVPSDEPEKQSLPSEEDISEESEVAVTPTPVTSAEEDPLDAEESDEAKDEEDPEEEEETEDEEEPEKEDSGEPEELVKPEKPEMNDKNEYYLQVVKTGEAPEWPKPKEDLDVFSQPLDNGLIQYWAYPKESGKTADSKPHAEEIAGSHKSDNAAIIIDQTADHLNPGCCLELVLTKSGHALAKTDSNLDNLEANITSLLDVAKQNFGITAEHFMSTSNVSPEVEKRLNDLEEADESKETSDFKTTESYNQSETKIPMEEEANKTSSYFNDRPAVTSEQKRSKFVVIIPILILIIIFGGIVYYRDKILSRFGSNTSSTPAATEATPTPTITPTPTPSIDRSIYKVRVLNGTPQTGAAGVLADKLKELGWQIDKTGNATSSAIQESYVRSKIDMDSEIIKALISDISDYEAASSSSILKTTDKADLEFVIGKK